MDLVLRSIRPYYVFRLPKVMMSEVDDRKM